MSEISNKFLVGMLVLAIALSLVGTAVTLQRVGKMEGVVATGWPTKDGDVNLTIKSLAALNLTVSQVNFGDIKVDPSYDNCVVNTTGYKSDGCDEVTAPTAGFSFTNIGNVNAKVELTFDETAATLINGTSPAYQYLCTVSSGFATDTLQIAGGSGNTCVESGWAPHETGTTQLQITVPKDATPGAKYDKITFTAIEEGA